MNHSNLISKIALDKNGKKLGKIIRIEDLPDKLSKKDKPHVIILVRRFLQKEVANAVQADKLLKVEANHAWFDILKKDFDQEIKNYLARRKHRAKSAKFGEVSDNDKAAAVSFQMRC